MPDIPLGRSSYFRGVAKEAQILTRNRFFEADPTLTTSQAALIGRPGMRRWIYVGDGPIRAVYSQPGSFNDALFVVSGSELWRVDKDGTKTRLQTGIAGGYGGAVSMAATAFIGTTPEFLFIADGAILYLYAANGYAIGTISGVPANNDVVQAGTVYYKFTNGSVDAGAPAGTLANPWLVALGANTAAAWQNLFDAFGHTATPGTNYSTALAINPSIVPTNNTLTSVTARASAVGALGNAVATTETGAAIAWTAATLTGGGAASVTQVQTPNAVGIISVGYIASYVVCVPAQGAGINGQFFWIQPGETTIDPIDFATAERSPDPINGVVVFGDQFYLPGTNTTEVFYFTGNLASPVARLQGVTFDRGTWAGTPLQVKESLIIVDSDGGVFQVGKSMFSGGIKRITEGHPDVEERIRNAIQYQAAQIFF